MDPSNKEQPKKTISLDDLLNSDSYTGSLFDSNKNDKKMSKKLTLSQIHEKKKDNKFYLPVLNLNHKEVWESLPISERKHFTDSVATETCLSNCCGVEGLQSACCKMDPNDLEHVLGPIDEKWIERTIKIFNKKGFSITRHDLVIDYEEGKIIGESLFNDHPVFRQKSSYPILRMQVHGTRYACKFLNTHNGKCTIYPIRPDMCRKYYCQYIRKNFLVKLKNNDNESGQWTAIDLHIDKHKKEE